MAHPSKYDNLENKEMVDYNSYFLEEDYPGEIEEMRKKAKYPDPLPVLDGPCVSKEYFQKFFSKEELADLCLSLEYKIRDLENQIKIESFTVKALCAQLSKLKDNEKNQDRSTYSNI